MFKAYAAKISINIAGKELSHFIYGQRELCANYQVKKKLYNKIK